MKPLFGSFLFEAKLQLFQTSQYIHFLGFPFSKTRQRHSPVVEAMKHALLALIHSDFSHTGAHEVLSIPRSSVTIPPPMNGLEAVFPMSSVHLPSCHKNPSFSKHCLRPGSFNALLRRTRFSAFGAQCIPRSVTQSPNKLQLLDVDVPLDQLTPVHEHRGTSKFRI